MDELRRVSSGWHSNPARIELRVLKDELDYYRGKYADLTELVRTQQETIAYQEDEIDRLRAAIANFVTDITLAL